MEIGKQSLDRLAALVWPRLWVLLWQGAKLAGQLARLSHAQSWCCIHKQERNNGSKTDSGLGLSGGHLQQAGHVAFLLLQIAEYANQSTTRLRRSTEETKRQARHKSQRGLVNRVADMCSSRQAKPNWYELDSLFRLVLCEFWWSVTRSLDASAILAAAANRHLC